MGKKTEASHWSQELVEQFSDISREVGVEDTRQGKQGVKYLAWTQQKSGFIIY